MRVRRRRLGAVAALGAAIVLLLATASGLRGAWFRWTTGLPRGAVVTYDAISLRWNALHVDGLRLTTPGGDASLEVPHADVTGPSPLAVAGMAGPLEVSLDAPRLTLSSGAASVSWLRAAVHDVTGWRPWHDGLHLSVANGTIEARSSGTPADRALIAVSDLGARIRVGPNAAVSYDVDAVCRDGAAPYPLHGHAAMSPQGTVEHDWTARALPLAAVLAFLRTDPAMVGKGGTLSDVSAAFRAGAAGTATDPRLRVSARIAAGDVTIGLRQHHLSGLHGAVWIVDDGIASPRIAGTLDGAALEIVGEVHDVHGEPFSWLSGGTSDLRGLAALAEKVAAQDDLRNVRLEAVAPGITLAQYTTQKPYGPLVVTVASVDPAEPTLRIDTVLAKDHITSGGERTSAMAARTGAVLGVNGDYYDIGGTWAPQGLVIHSGLLLRTPTQRMALAVHRDHRVTFDEYRLSGTLRVGTAEFPITQINSWPAGAVTLITPEYGTIPAAPDMTLAQLEPRDPERTSFRVVAVGRAVQKTAATFALALGPGQAVPLRAGQVVTVRYGVVPSAADAVAAVGGGPLLLHGGTWYEDPHPPAPDERDVHWAVVAVGRMPDDSLLFFQVDGRHPERSIGMTRPDFAALMQGFGVVDAMALDSGGSSTIVSRVPGDAVATVRNHPSDNDGERWVSNGLFVYSSAPPAPLLTAHAFPGGEKPAAAAGGRSSPAAP